RKWRCMRGFGSSSPLSPAGSGEKNRTVLPGACMRGRSRRAAVGHRFTRGRSQTGATSAKNSRRGKSVSPNENGRPRREALDGAGLFCDRPEPRHQRTRVAGCVASQPGDRAAVARLQIPEVIAVIAAALAGSVLPLVVPVRLPVPVLVRDRGVRVPVV